MSENVITTVIAEYNQTAADLAKMELELAGKAYDVTNATGMAMAKFDRRNLVTLRTGLEALRKEAKAPALKRCQDIDSEAKAITARILALEEPVDKLIKDEEAKKEAEKAEKARLAAEAQKVLDDKILEIGKLPLRCIGLPVEDIELFLSRLEAKEIGGEFTGETRNRAEAAKAEAVAEIKNMLAVALERAAAEAEQKAQAEALAVKQEAERVEREAAEQAQREEMARQQAILDQQRKEQEAEAARLKALADEEDARQTAARKAEQEAADALQAERDAIAKAEKDKADAAAAEERARQAKEEAERQEEARKQAVIAEEARKKAETERKEAEKKARLLAAKCKDSATAFKKILAICQDKETLSPAEALNEIAILCEANI